MLELFSKPVGFFLIIMTIILITPLLSERVRLPGIVGIILGGMLIGPHGFGIVQDNDRIQFLATIGWCTSCLVPGWKWISTSS